MSTDLNFVVQKLFQMLKLDRQQLKLMSTGPGFVVQKLFKMLKLDRQQLIDENSSRFCGSKTF
jgi:hypothetical protein